MDSLFGPDATNLSIFSLPATLLLAALPHWYSIYTAETLRVQGGWSNTNPRAWVARLNSKAATGKKLSATEEMILRAQSAQQNGFEWFSVWAVAVVLGNIAKLPVSTLNSMTAFHLITRIIYYILYVKTSTRKSSIARTAAFQINLIAALRLIFKSGFALM